MVKYEHLLVTKDLHKRLKQISLDRDITLTALVEMILTKFANKTRSI